MARPFQQCGILTSLDSDQPVQSPFIPRQEAPLGQEMESRDETFAEVHCSCIALTFSVCNAPAVQ